MSENIPEIRNKHIELNIGKKIRWGKDVVFGVNCRKVTIGFGCFIGNGVYIDVEHLEIGDYCTIHHGSVIHGKKCIIGHNNWIGHYTILDSLGGLLQLGDNVGVGAHSQLWSHMKFGDMLAGCRWHRNESLVVGNDVWFVGHCIVAPIKAEDRSMLLAGGLAVKDMKYNHIYSGTTAKDVTDKLGTQFKEHVSYEEKLKKFEGYIAEYENQCKDVSFIKYGRNFPEHADPDHTWFNIENRKYKPSYRDDEYDFMRFLLYEKAKFMPV
ncbi:MAG: hypothetical protein KJ645_10300 [Planctomycetes bacterium]|nr:hypothetical protein [Planctomycetota bacterium]